MGGKNRTRKHSLENEVIKIKIYALISISNKTDQIFSPTWNG